jgi:hypothetical protein
MTVGKIVYCYDSRVDYPTPAVITEVLEGGMVNLVGFVCSSSPILPLRKIPYSDVPQPYHWSYIPKE